MAHCMTPSARMDALIREVKFPEQPQAAPETEEEKKQDASAVGALSNQINEAHSDMLGTGTAWGLTNTQERSPTR